MREVGSYEREVDETTELPAAYYRRPNIVVRPREVDGAIRRLLAQSDVPAGEDTEGPTVITPSGETVEGDQGGTYATITKEEANAVMREAYIQRGLPVPERYQ